jgi:hypothetical protein
MSRLHCFVLRAHLTAERALVVLILLFTTTHCAFIVSFPPRTSLTKCQKQRRHSPRFREWSQINILPKRFVIHTPHTNTQIHPILLIHHSKPCHPSHTSSPNSTPNRNERTPTHHPPLSVQRDPRSPPPPLSTCLTDAETERLVAEITAQRRVPRA